MKIAIAAAAVTTVLLLLGILLGTDEYQAGMLSTIAFLAWVWVFVESLESAIRDCADAEPTPMRMIGESTQRCISTIHVRPVEALPVAPDTSHAAQLEHHRRRHLADLAAIADGTHSDGAADEDIGEWEDA